MIPSTMNGTTGDPAPGNLSSGTGTYPFTGQVGAIIQLTEAMANQLSAASGGFATLHEGLYQYVNFLSTSTQSNAGGNIAFWSNRLTKVVTPDATGNLGQVAGVILASTTKGNYAWMQISGVATVNFKTTLTPATPAAGDLVIVDQSASTVGTCDIAQTTLTGLQERSLLGTAITAPAGSSPSTIDLWAIRMQP